MELALVQGNRSSHWGRHNNVSETMATVGRADSCINRSIVYNNERKITMSEKKGVIITGVHQDDAHYERRHMYVGKTGMFELRPPHTCKGYYAGNFWPDNKEPIQRAFFLGVRYQKL